jgi:hypothetical protein
MPCYDYGSSPSGNAMHQVSELEAEVSKLRKRNHALMRAICEVDVKVIQFYSGSLHALSLETRKLIIKHRREDAKRSK